MVITWCTRSVVLLYCTLIEGGKRKRTTCSKYNISFSQAVQNSSWSFHENWKTLQTNVEGMLYIKPSGNILLGSFFLSYTYCFSFRSIEKVSWLVSNGQTMDKSLDSCHKSHQFSVYPNMRSMELVVLSRQENDKHIY